MGNCTSAPQKEEHLTPAEKVHQEVEDVEVDLPDTEEEDLELSNFDLSSLDITNPSLQEFSGSSAIGWLKEVRIHLSPSVYPLPLTILTQPGL